MKVMILILMLNAGFSLVVVAFSLFVGISESFQEMAILTIAPIILFTPIFAINFLLLLGLRKVQQNWRTPLGIIVIALSTLLAGANLALIIFMARALAGQ